MYKKYMINPKFKELVSPSGVERPREKSFALTENRMTLQSKQKKCCK